MTRRAAKSKPESEASVLTLHPVSAITRVDYAFDLNEVAKAAGYNGMAVISGSIPIAPGYLTDDVITVEDRWTFLSDAIGKSAGQAIDARQFPPAVSNRLKEVVRLNLAESKLPIEG